MKIFFDFDYTLFHTKQFRDDFGDIFERRGATRDLYEEGYRAAHCDWNAEHCVYNMNEHLRYVLDQKPDFDIERARKDIDNMVIDTRSYVFPDVFDFLEDLRKLGVELYIVTFGARFFQNMKIRGSGLVSYFEEIFIISCEKYKPIQSIRKAVGEQIWFFDDRTDCLEDVKSHLPEVKTVQVSRLEGRYVTEQSKYANFIVTDFEEARKLSLFC